MRVKAFQATPEPGGLGLEAVADCLAGVLSADARGLVIAVSGGPDSMALMASVARLRGRMRLPPITVGTVDHGLRAEGADEAEAVADAARHLGLPCQILVWRGPKPAHAIQEKAREARYGLLLALCREVGADHLATAHTLDDQAETVLFRLLRGSGPAGLAGMADVVRRDGIRHVRPLLGVGKARLVATCAALGVSYRTDPSNSDPRFARARMREIAPLLAREGLDASALARIGRRAGRAEAALRHAAAAAHATCRIDGDGGHLDGRRLASLPLEFAVRILGQTIEAVGMAAPRLDRLERLAERIVAAVGLGRPLVATLGGARLALGSGGVIAVTVEGVRRRGMGECAPAPRGQTARFVPVHAIAESFPWQG